MSDPKSRKNYDREKVRIDRALKKTQAAIKQAWLKEEDGVVSKSDLPMHKYVQQEGFLTEKSKELLDDSKLAEVGRAMLEKQFPHAKTQEQAAAIILEQDRANRRDPESELILSTS